MEGKKAQLNDIGVLFILEVWKRHADTVMDISGATTMEIVFEKPSGTTVTKTAAHVTDGTDGQMCYTSVDGDLDEPGKWHWQGYVVTPSWDGHTLKHSFDVISNLL